MKNDVVGSLIGWARADVDLVTPPDFNMAFLDEFLRHCKTEYDDAPGDPKRQRRALHNLLIGLSAVINSRATWRRAGVAAPLRDIAIAFDSLDRGFTEPLLSRSRVSPRSQTWVRVRAYGAAASEVLKQGGWTEKSADKWVADKLRAAGYTLTKTKKKITGPNITGFRQKCRDAPADDNLRVIYEHLLTSITETKKPSGDPGKIAKNCASQLIYTLCLMDKKTPPVVPIGEISDPYG